MSSANGVLEKSFAIQAKVEELEDAHRYAESEELEEWHDKWFGQYEAKVEAYMDDANAEAEAEGKIIHSLTESSKRCLLKSVSNSSLGCLKC